MFEHLFFSYIGRYTPEIIIFGNSLDAYIKALIVSLFLWVIFALVYKILFVRARHFVEKTETVFDDVVLEIFNSIRPQFYVFIAFYIGIETLSLGSFVDSLLTVALYFWISLYLIRAIVRITRVFIRQRAGDDEVETLATTRFLTGLMGGVLWILAGLFILSNLGIEVTSLIAGLGIGGLAVAFALQNILADLFSSFAIYFDKPFVVGDFIQVGEHLGEVKKTGIKTTRITSISGEELIFSNQELTSTHIQNFGRMKERRIQFRFGVTYDTPKAKLEDIKKIVETLVKNTNDTRFDRVHFKTLGDSAFIFEVVYFVLSPEYADYMDVQEKINLGLVDSFQKEGIEFAFPTQTIHLQK